MTSDQGLARMCLSEGMDVAFYRAGQLEDIADTVFTGTTFRPFKHGLHHTALADLIWEMAVTFGACRLRASHAELEVLAIGEALNWTPYHAAEDLLWLRINRHKKEAGESNTIIPLPPEAPTDAALAAATAPPQSDDSKVDVPNSVQLDPPSFIETDFQMTMEGETTDQGEVGGQTRSPERNTTDRGEALAPALVIPQDYEDVSETKRTFIPAYKFSPGTMLRLIQDLAGNGSMSNAEVMSKFHFTHERKVQEYRGFLLSSELISYEQGVLIAAERLQTLWNALKANDFPSFAPLLCSSAGMQSIQEIALVGQGTPATALSIREAAAPGYICLQEMSGILLEIYEDGVYSTPNRPFPQEFRDIAYSTYLEHARTEGVYIASGTWLETMAKKHGVHPLWSRRMLEEARVQRLLERYVEGSTPETRFSRHAFCMSSFDGGTINVKQVALFEGDFLLPGKSSASLRLKRPS